MNYSILISLIALSVSIYTFWLTRVKKGVIKMTRPTVIFFGPDGIGKEQKKVFIRTLLYSTSERGKYVQNMFVRLHRAESVQNFNVWVYDDKGLVRGSGLFVNKSGTASNHHFLMPKDGTKYDFLSGEYLLEIFVEAVDENPIKIFEQRLPLTASQQDEMSTKKVGTYFDWAPNSQSYFSHIDTGPKENKEFSELIDRLTDKE